LTKQRIGILGGTFDPIHQGHLQMALSVLRSVHLDQLLIMPTGDPPYKRCQASPEDRWKMLVAACSCDGRLIPSRLEMDRGFLVYTVDTLLILRQEYPKADLFYIIGADAMMKLHHWQRFDEVLPLCTFLVCPRLGAAEPAAFQAEWRRLTRLGARLIQVEMDPMPVSSTEVRTAFSEELISSGLPVPVQEYCSCKGLYGLSGRLEHIDEWMDLLFAALTPHRFAHSLSVAYTAVRLARLNGLDTLKAEQAGLLHDCAKCLPLKEMQQIALDHHLTDDSTILSSGALLHSLVGAWVAEHTYGMTDPEVLEAIACHNTGRPGMSPLAMCVCLADSIEPTRASYPLLDQVRLLADTSLVRALLLSLEGTSSFVRSRGKYLHPRTQETIAWLKTLPENPEHK